MKAQLRLNTELKVLETERTNKNKTPFSNLNEAWIESEAVLRPKEPSEKTFTENLQFQNSIRNIPQTLESYITIK